MPLTPSEIDEADDLLVSLAFGALGEKEAARIALMRWAGTNADRLHYIATHEELDCAIDSHVPELRARFARHRKGATRPEARARVSLGRFGAFATPLLMCIGIAAIWSANPTLSTQAFSSAVGEQAKVDLGEGSVLPLNTDTAGIFLNRLRSREVVLDRGEALFSVAHSEWRPFQVRAGTAIVRDIGTRFTVRADRIVQVAVLEGQVQLSSAGQPDSILLDPHQAAQMDRGEIVQLSGSEQFDALVGWKDKRLQFDGTSLLNVVLELQRYRKGPIVIQDAQAANYRVTGGFSSVDPDLLLKTLPDVVPVSVRFLQDGTALIEARP